MRIEASAPTRIDLAGGTIDMWPLYLFHEGAQTINVAISLRASCVLRPRRDGRLRLISEDTGSTLEVDHWSALGHDRELRLLRCILRYFQVTGVDLVTRSDSPIGAGLAGSSALTVALCAAAARWQGVRLGPERLLDIARDLEAQTIDVPTGVQDYRPALYGGIAAVELTVGRVERVPLPVPPAELERRLVLAYTGASRNSGINNWEVFRRHIDGDPSVIEPLSRIRDAAAAMRTALERQDWREVGRQIAVEWEHRKALAPGVTTPLIDQLIQVATEAGATGCKICGAGGGGCLVAFSESDRQVAIASALAAAGAQVLAFHVETEGLRIAKHADAATEQALPIGPGA